MRKKRTRLLSWENREEDLRKVIRYRRFKVMFYRTNLALHSARVQQLVQRLLPFALRHYPSLDPRKTILISRFHDDHEMVSKRGDVPLQLKLAMGHKDLSKLQLEELAAVDFLSDMYGNPEIEGYRYRDLAAHAILKDCPEAHLHSFADKLDGYCEALHETLAGNLGFLGPVITYITQTFNRPSDWFPLIIDAFREDNGLFSFPAVDLQGYCLDDLGTSRPHTALSVQRRTDIPHYELWKEVTLDLPNGLEFLHLQTEFHPEIAPAPHETPVPMLQIASRQPAARARSRSAARIVS